MIELTGELAGDLAGWKVPRDAGAQDGRKRREFARGQPRHGGQRPAERQVK
jgi:hypothetical protein